VASLLWLYYVVELVQALLEREVRGRCRRAAVECLLLYPKRAARRRRPNWCSTRGGHRRHRLLDEQGQNCRFREVPQLPKKCCWASYRSYGLSARRRVLDNSRKTPSYITECRVDSVADHLRRRTGNCCGSGSADSMAFGEGRDLDR
jgi:hypothetical protein